MKQPGWKVVWDKKAMVPYAYNGTKNNANNDTSVWITYDNERSIEHKLDYLIVNQLGGSMVWSVGLDDATGDCGDGHFPLMKLQMFKLNQGL